MNPFGTQSRRVALKILTSADASILNEFMARCRSAGYANNASLETLKFNSSSLSPTFWAGIDLDENKIMAISGFHLLEDGSSARIAFRSCFLNPGYSVFKSSVGKSWWRHSFIFNFILPLQVEHLLGQGIKTMYMTSNIRPEKSNQRAKHFEVDSLMLPRLAKTGIISLKAERVNYFSCLQNFWELDVSKFSEFVQQNRTYQRPDIEMLYP